MRIAFASANIYPASLEIKRKRNYLRFSLKIKIVKKRLQFNSKVNFSIVGRTFLGVFLAEKMGRWFTSNGKQTLWFIDLLRMKNFKWKTSYEKTSNEKKLQMRSANACMHIDQIDKSLWQTNGLFIAQKKLFVSETWFELQNWFLVYNLPRKVRIKIDIFVFKILSK